MVDSSLNSSVLKKLDIMETEYFDLSKKLASDNIDFSSSSYLDITKRYSFLENVISLYKEYKLISSQIIEIEELLNNDSDDEILDLLKSEKIDLSKKHINLIEALYELLFSIKFNQNSSVIMEIRAGTGGDEACLFVSDLYRMYFKFSEKKDWKLEILSISYNEGSSFKEIVYSVSGKGVYEYLRFESGVHRVQRVPVTESKGRIHTSTVTVAVLEEIKDSVGFVDILVNDVKVDTYRAQGAGGQHVNTTDSAVRLTHLPTGIVVQCQNEKSQHKNKSNAMRILKVKVFEKKKKDKEDEISLERRKQIGTGSRSEKIRTYNFSQNRITDHRVSVSFADKLQFTLNGNLEHIVKLLKYNIEE